MTLGFASRVKLAIRCLRGDVVGMRVTLPTRRESETLKFEHSGFKWFATASRFSDGSLSEIFLSTSKSGTLMQAMASDLATCTSIALQYGAPLGVIRRALTREGASGAPATPLSKALDELSEGADDA